MDRAIYIAIRKKLDLSHDRWALTIHATQNIALIGLIAAFYLSHSPLQWFAIPLTSILIFRNFSMMHEAVHRAASKNHRLNEWAGNLAGGICLLPYEPWKKSHLEHHMWAGNIEKDPVMALVNAFPKWQPGSKKTVSFLWQAWFPILACMQYSVFYWLAWKTYLKNPGSTKLLISLAFPIAIWGGTMALVPAAFTLQILAPALLLYLLMVEVVNFPHHLQLPQYEGETKLAFWDQYKIARSCIYPNWFARLVALNFNFHTEHHMFPDVPWYHLDKLHLEVSHALQTSYNTDPNFSWIVENKRYPMNEVLKTRNSGSLQEENTNQAS